MKKSILCKIGHVKYKMFERISERYLSKIRNKFLKNKNFTIISNNCWGGWVYRSYNLPYLSPTIGLFIMPDDYLKFIKRLKYYINECELKFINVEKSKYNDELKKHPKYGEYPIGVLDDIEIMFLHYSSEEEARVKWNRRCQRINWDNLIIKFNDQNGCEQHHIDEFNKIDFYEKMICFVAKNIPGRYNIWMWEFFKDKYVVDDKYWCSLHLNIKNLIEKGKIC